MIIKNVKVFTEDKTFEPGAIGIENGIFKNNLFDSGEIIDGEGCYAIPGLIDVHFHGCMGYDFCDGTKEAIEKIAEYEASQGVTTIVPATMTLSEEELMKIMANGGTYENKKVRLCLLESIWKDRLSVRRKREHRQQHIFTNQTLRCSEGFRRQQTD